MVVMFDVMHIFLIMAEKVIRYKCRFCKKTFAKNNYAEKHEQNCFYNSKSKSCAKCLHLTLEHTIDSKLLSNEEKQIIENPINEVHGISVFDDDAKMQGFEYYPEFMHLFNNLDVSNYCKKLKTILPKLRTNCDSFDCA